MTNPYRTTTDTTYGVTSYQYDMLEERQSRSRRRVILRSNGAMMARQSTVKGTAPQIRSAAATTPGSITPTRAATIGSRGQIFGSPLYGARAKCKR